MSIGRNSTEHQELYVVVGCVEESLIIDFRHVRRPIESLERPSMIWGKSNINRLWQH